MDRQQRRVGGSRLGASTFGVGVATLAALGLLLAGCSAGSSSAEVSTAAVASSQSVAASTTAVAAVTTPTADAAMKGYLDVINRDSRQVQNDASGYFAKCRIPDSPRLDQCRSIAVSIAADCQRFLDELGALAVPTALTTGDSTLRDVLRQMIAAAKTVETLADQQRHGPLPADLVDLPNQLEQATGAINNQVGG